MAVGTLALAGVNNGGDERAVKRRDASPLGGSLSDNLDDLEEAQVPMDQR